MKITPFAVPAILASVGLCWVGARQREIHQMRGETSAQGKRVASAAKMPATRARNRAIEPERARLRRLAAALSDPGWGWLRTDLKEQEELESMSREELIAALEGLDDAGLEKDNRSRLSGGCSRCWRIWIRSM